MLTSFPSTSAHCTRLQWVHQLALHAAGQQNDVAKAQ